MAPGSDLITDRTLHRVGGPVDVAGGWFDAGDYLKFTHSTAYNDVLLFTSARLLGHRAPQALTAEARYGLHWLEKMWDADARAPSTSRSGSARATGPAPSAATTTCGGSPRPTTATPATADRFVSHRPVFAAAPAGQPISPNLVGRVVAAFALAAQADAPHHRSRARHELRQAAAPLRHGPRPATRRARW